MLMNRNNGYIYFGNLEEKDFDNKIKELNKVYFATEIVDTNKILNITNVYYGLIVTNKNDLFDIVNKLKRKCCRVYLIKRGKRNSEFMNTNINLSCIYSKDNIIDITDKFIL